MMMEGMFMFYQRRAGRSPFKMMKMMKWGSGMIWQFNKRKKAYPSRSPVQIDRARRLFVLYSVKTGTPPVSVFTGATLATVTVHNGLSAPFNLLYSIVAERTRFVKEKGSLFTIRLQRPRNKGHGLCMGQWMDGKKGRQS